MTEHPLIKSIKIALAAVIAIIIATRLGLLYAVSAGTIAILSIRNTKRETLKTAANRGLAFLCALGIGFLSFSAFGFNLIAFGVFCFSLPCCALSLAGRRHWHRTPC